MSALSRLNQLLATNGTTEDDISEELKQEVIAQLANSTIEQMNELLHTIAGSVKTAELFNELIDILNEVFAQHPELLWMQNQSKQTILVTAVTNRNIYFTQYLLRQFSRLPQYPVQSFSQFFSGAYDAAKQFSSHNGKSKQSAQEKILRLLHHYGAILLSNYAEGVNAAAFLDQEYHALYPKMANRVSPYNDLEAFLAAVNDQSQSSSSTDAQTVLMTHKPYWQAFNMQKPIAALHNRLNTPSDPPPPYEASAPILNSVPLIKNWLLEQDQELDAFAKAHQREPANLFRFGVNWVLDINEENHLRNTFLYSWVPGLATYGFVELIKYNNALSGEMKDQKEYMNNIYSCNLQGCVPTYSELGCDDQSEAFRQDYADCHALFNKNWGATAGITLVSFALLGLAALAVHAPTMRRISQPIFGLFKMPFHWMADAVGPYTPSKNVENKVEKIQALKNILAELKRVSSDQQKAPTALDGKRDKEITQQDLSAAIAQVEKLLEDYDQHPTAALILNASTIHTITHQKSTRDLEANRQHGNTGLQNQRQSETTALLKHIQLN